MGSLALVHRDLARTLCVMASVENMHVDDWQRILVSRPDCGWGMSARMGDVGTVGSARFSQAALARLGQAVALAVGEVVQAVFEAVLPWEAVA